ncbi:MAG: hypothetical protein JSV88_33525 [Candidatus Aminicenantes bacterium]|nr:MAG: hypothetical protein JSV88_33525 [Candidatus Aminicenantes bacterium]
MVNQKNPIQEEKLKTKIITVVVLILFAAVNAAALDMTALKGLKKKTSKSESGTWVKYKSKKTPIKNFRAGSVHLDYDNTMFYLYIGVKDEKEAFLRMHVQVEPAVDWINFNKIIITADEETFVREFARPRLNTTIALRQQFLEFYDEEVMPHEIKMFEKIIASKEVTIRYKGEEREQDLKLKKKHLQAIKDILEAWKKLNH